MARATTAATAIFARTILRFYTTWAFDERFASSRVSPAPKDINDVFRSLLLPMLAVALK
jgi:hypothetical protein